MKLVMEDRESALSPFIEGFEAIGFRQVPVVYRWHPRSRFFRHERSTGAAEYFAALDFKPRMLSFDLGLGVANQDAMLLLKDTLPVLQKYLSPEVREAGLLTSPCWTMFSAGRALKWDLMAIPAPKSPASWPVQLREVETKLLEPILFSIINAEGILNLLLRDDDPLLWWAAGSAVLRTAQIIALSRVAGVDMDSVRARLAPFETWIGREMEGVKDPALLINELARAMHTSH